MLLETLVVLCLLSMIVDSSVAIVALMLLVAALPFVLAGRDHCNRFVVGILGFVGIFTKGLFLLWLIAFFWSIAGKNEKS